MPLIKSEYSCPKCRKLGKKSQICADMGILRCDTDGTHVWNDHMEFFNEGPVMEFKVEVPKNLPQQGHSPMTVSLPTGMEQALSAKYGEKTNATVASILQQMLEGNILIIGQTDFERLVGHLGATPQSAGELVGMVYALKETATDEKARAEAIQKDLSAYEGMSKGRVIVDLDDQYTNAMDRARGAELPLKLFIEQKVRDAIRDNWF